MSAHPSRQPKSELGEFLRARRAAVSPESVGMPASTRRRVPGLRREEVAALIGLSSDYYVRMEQGRVGRPSESVLEGLVRVLRLNDAERTHLYDLTRPRSARLVPPGQPAAALPDFTGYFLDTLMVPALVMTRTAQVIGWNAMASEVFADFGALAESERNTAWLLFNDEELAARHRDWEHAARSTVGILRMTAGQEPNRADLRALVGDLSVASETFRRLWAEHHVFEKTTGIQRMRHPALGDIDLTFVSWTNPATPDQILVTYTPEPGSESAHAIGLLGGMLASAQSVDGTTEQDTSSLRG